MRRLVPFLFAVAVSPFLFGAGCGGEISFHGSGGGTETAEYKCTKGNGQLKVVWRGEKGSLSVRVVDAAADPLAGPFERSFFPTGSDQTFTQSFTGPSSFTVTATRTSEWKGAYTVTFSCT